jgi:integrase
MPRQRTGSAYLKRGSWFVQLTKPDGTRTKPVRLDGGAGDWTLAAARAKALELQAILDAEPREPKPAGAGETVTAWFARWFDDRKSRGIVTAENERGRFNKWAGALGKRRMASVTAADIEDLVERLDRASQAYAEAEKNATQVDRASMLSWKSAKNVWGIVTKGFDDATRSKTRTLRVLKKNPAENVRGPERGVRKARTYMTPDRFVAFASNEGIPLVWRRAVTIAIYTYVRASELRALDWSDVRLDDGFISVHRTVSDTGATGTTKTQQPRMVPIEPTLVPLLLEMRGRRRAGRVVELDATDDQHLARGFRRWLRRGGSLDDLASSATKAAITWHDLRATGITWRAIRGDEPMRIMRSAGHQDMQTTMRYVRDADVLRAGVGRVFPALPAALLGAIQGDDAKVTRSARAGNHSLELVGEVGFEPTARPQNNANEAENARLTAGFDDSDSGGSDESLRGAIGELRGLASSARSLSSLWDVLEMGEEDAS